MQEKLSKAYDYTVNVLQCQKRILDNDTMYKAYNATIGVKNRLDKDTYLVVYNTIKDMLRDITDQDGRILN